MTKRTIIYKPSNQNFSQQGAVSSGLRTLNAKVNNINKNANSFYTAWGREGGGGRAVLWWLFLSALLPPPPGDGQRPHPH